jgi:FKBP-type peptidyl-prolyl cis-trans isomerase FklB
MKYKYSSFLVVAIVFATVSSSSFAQSKASKKNKPAELLLKTETDNISYSLGVTVGTNLKMNGVDSINADVLAAAIKDIYSSTKLKIDEDSAKWILDNYFVKLKEMQDKKSIGESQKFLGENKTKPGVIQLPSGLQYKVLNQGVGSKPTAQDTVTVHYVGQLTTGTIFDSSVERNEPATFPVSMVIPGWTEALQLMPVGSKWVLYIPSNLGYGERGAGGVIPPNSTLIFEVELLSIN